MLPSYLRWFPNFRHDFSIPLYIYIYMYIISLYIYIGRERILPKLIGIFHCRVWLPDGNMCLFLYSCGYIHYIVYMQIRMHTFGDTCKCTHLRQVHAYCSFDCTRIQHQYTYMHTICQTNRRACPILSIYVQTCHKSLCIYVTNEI